MINDNEQPYSKELNIIHLYFKYRHSSFKEMIEDHQQIDKFIDRIQRYEIIFKNPQRRKSKITIDAIPEPKKKKKSLSRLKTQPRTREDSKQMNEERKINLPPINKHKLTIPSQKVFLILGGYPDLTKALLKRGWVSAKDSKR